MTRPPFFPARAALAAALLAAGCDGGDPVGSGPDTARLRVFNAVTNQGATIRARETDVLVDSSTAPPGAAALSPNTGTQYADVQAGAHAYVARRAGDLRLGGQANLLGFNARATLAGGFDYTLYVIGVVGVDETAAVAPLLLADDPFPPSRAADGAALQARVRLVNAAPFAGGSAAGAGTLLRLYVTPGGAPAPAAVTTLAPAASVQYRQASAALELPAGSYTFTAAQPSGRIVAQATLSLPAGAARTLVATSGEPTTSPAPANHALAVLTDRDF
ncbi:MAG: DUF4397 domain-containing protein [Gemmatimonadota bacterium]